MPGGVPETTTVRDGHDPSRATPRENGAESMGGVAAPEGYVPVYRLASGGMGTVDVCLRVEGSFERLCALKRPHPHLQRDPEFMKMFRREARLSGLVRHANVVATLDYNEDASGPFLLMDYVEGVPASAFIRSVREAQEFLPIQHALTIAIHACRGLHAIHSLKDHEGRESSVVHRDISLANLVIGRDGVTRITDFGIARAVANTTVTNDQSIKGTVGYMAPERLQGKEATARADLFSIGVVLYELVAGKRLYTGQPGEQVRQIVMDAPPDIMEIRPDAPAALVKALFSLLAKSPEARPASAHEAAENLQGIFDRLVAEEGRLNFVEFIEELVGEQLESRRAAIEDSIPERRTALSAGASGSNAKRMASVAVVGVLALVAAAAALLWQRTDAAPQARPAVGPANQVESSRTSAAQPMHQVASPDAGLGAGKETPIDSTDVAPQQTRRPRRRTRTKTSVNKKPVNKKTVGKNPKKVWEW